MNTNPAGMAYKFLNVKDTKQEEEPVQKGLLNRPAKARSKEDASKIERIAEYVSMIRNKRMENKNA